MKSKGEHNLGKKLERFTQKLLWGQAGTKIYSRFGDYGLWSEIRRGEEQEQV